MVLYGDSITENWRGTSAGELWKWSNGTLDSRFVGWNMRAVFETAFQNYRAGVMAIAGVPSPALFLEDLRQTLLRCLQPTCLAHHIAYVLNHSTLGPHTA